METNTKPCHPSIQNERLHELNPGGIDPITVDAPAAPPRPIWPMPESARDGIDGAMIVIALCALAILAVGFVGGVWACKAGGW